MSLRRRLLVGLVVVAVVLVGTNVALANTSRSFLLERVDRQLIDVASRPIFREPGGPGRGRPRAQPGLQSALDRTLSEYFIAVEDEAGTLTPLTSEFIDEGDAPTLDRSRIDAHVPSPGMEPRPFTVRAASGGSRWRLVVVDSPRQSLTVIGYDLGDVDTTVRRLRAVGIGGTIAVLAALGLVSFWILRLGIQPVEAMAGSADRIARGDLSHRVDHPSPDTEAGRLGLALNSMLDRIEESFRAQQASEDRVRRFAADASHELRTPLTSIRGYAELYRTGALARKADLSDAMRRMEQEATRMGALVEDLLLLARLDQKAPAPVAPVRLDLIAADAVRDARAVEPDRPIDLDTEPVTVEGDEMRLRQVAANLLANARVHTPASTPVHVRVDAENGFARLVVADEGPGLAPAVAAQVFERFYRADEARTRASGGSGLGLSIVQAVAQAHGGDATVTSTPGQGAAFTVTLPRSTTAAPT